MSQGIARTAEHVSAGHPDKFCDQVADRILDEVLTLAAQEGEKVLPSVRTAIECLAKDDLLIVSGEVKLTDAIRARLDVVELARTVWKEIGYGEDGERLTVINHIRSQSPDIAEGKTENSQEETRSDGVGTDFGGAGDQGIMVGYATRETAEGMPLEWLLARNLCQRLHDLRRDGTLGWLRSDCKTQISLDPSGKVTSVIVAAQHADAATDDEILEGILRQAVEPVVGYIPERVSINGTGRFVIGGPTGDAGVVGRKIVVDAYGPRISVGGGAYSGKDPTKVDRSAAYMCRHIARTVLAHHPDVRECTVSLAYGIGKRQPEMVTAVSETGRDLSGWVQEKFPDLSPGYIIESLGLRHPNGWSYYKTASYGHYGRDIFPWEKVAQIRG
jgi:S-adenosylmethionine synthetase